MARPNPTSDEPKLDQPSHLTSDDAAPELADAKQAEKFKFVGTGLPTEVHPAWAGRYKLLHGRVCLRSRGKPSAENPSGELVSNWYERGVIVKLSAIDAQRFYNLGVVSRVDEDGEETDLPAEIRDATLYTKNQKLKVEFSKRDQEARGELQHQVA